MSPSRRRLAWVLLPILFVGSCAALLPVGMTIADPITHRPLYAFPGAPFPVVITTGGVPRVHFIQDVRHTPTLPAGSSYLIPSGEDKHLQDELNARRRAGADGGWVLRVHRVAPRRQHIELYWMSDGYSGGGYEATASSISPRYRKLTGPGFAFIFGGITLVMNLVLWSAAIAGIRWWFDRRRPG
jgi:hypothetical protein